MQASNAENVSIWWRHREHNEGKQIQLCVYFMGKSVKGQYPMRKFYGERSLPCHWLVSVFMRMTSHNQGNEPSGSGNLGAILVTDKTSFPKTFVSPRGTYMYTYQDSTKSQASKILALNIIHLKGSVPQCVMGSSKSQLVEKIHFSVSPRTVKCL